MGRRGYIFTFLLNIPAIVFASVFDADFEPCYREIDYSKIKFEGEKLLEGDNNFILFQPHTDNKIYYILNCPRRVFALRVINDRSKKYSDEIINRALEVLAYQSTFTPEVATGIIEFIKSSPNQELRAQAGFAFYFLFDHFPDISIQLDYFKRKEFKEFYKNILTQETNQKLTSWFAQAAQKTAAYFYDPGSVQYCYREHFTDKYRELGEELARTLLPIVVQALVLKGDLNSEGDQISKNELLVAIGNFAYSRFLKYDAHTLKLLNDYFQSEKVNDLREILLRVPAINEYIKGDRRLSSAIPKHDNYCGN
ncbi:MAG: hypothetical protein A4S09_06140 [Proteobacteria bacterium SG_bin7]|nr:MAG: hypothetical protein A4S09_06140 [Proteobacteria bacterium SG_bin7]